MVRGSILRRVYWLLGLSKQCLIQLGDVQESRCREVEDNIARFVWMWLMNAFNEAKYPDSSYVEKVFFSCS